MTEFKLTIYDVIIQKTMSPRKSDGDFMIKFRKFQEGQKQSFVDALKIGVFKICEMSQENICVGGSFK